MVDGADEVSLLALLPSFFVVRCRKYSVLCNYRQVDSSAYNDLAAALDSASPLHQGIDSAIAATFQIVDVIKGASTVTFMPPVFASWRKPQWPGAAASMSESSE
jgi:hypothetical protein